MTRSSLTGKLASKLIRNGLRENLLYICRRALADGMYKDEFMPAQSTTMPGFVESMRPQVSEKRRSICLTI
jgi:hypothetical protein